MTTKVTGEMVAEALRELGSTGPEIAKALLARGIKGVPDEPDMCPLANYCNEKWPSEEIWILGEQFRVRADRFDSPPGVEEFVQDFDGGEYEELVEEAYDFDDYGGDEDDEDLDG